MGRKFRAPKCDPRIARALALVRDAQEKLIEAAELLVTLKIGEMKMVGIEEIITGRRCTAKRRPAAGNAER